ncbi:disease resistance protein RPM1 [Eucalyptus grandis]|uniref:disease resistance protein RPM1 n=1 Tax=Eucalyptus grandis TaxID=71139 RepID=UPI00192EC256|nr:disease resistance protein RPM1 [Eucalyptus grandis]
MYHAEEFIDQFHLREARERHDALHRATWPLVALISKCKLWRDLSILVNKMEGLCDEKFLKEGAEGRRNKELASSSSHDSVPWQGNKLARLTSFWDQYEPTFFNYLDARKKDLLERIRAKSTWYPLTTSIWARQGAGKTILARWVYNQAKYMDYEQRAWVRVSASMDKREFLCEILKQVEKQASEMKDVDIEEIRKTLIRKLAKTERFLIVLDDVKPSNEPLLRELAMSIPPSSQGHIITTTEDTNIASYMNTSGEKPIELDKLGDEESQKMLAWKLHGERDIRKLKIEEKNIVKVCDGWPLYISLLTGFLSNAGEQERAALGKEGFIMTSLDILKLSCHQLPAYLKPCFIYMALFPVGFPIPTRRLVRLWLAEGLLDSRCYNIERDRKRQPEDVGETFILELADRNVIHVVSQRADGSPKACRMLTPLHDMIRPIAMSMGFLHIHATSELKDIKGRDPTNQQQQLQNQQIRWLAEHTNIVTDIHSGSYPALKLGHIRSFLSFYLRRGLLTKDVSTFLRKMTSETNYSLLRVLDLEGVYKPTLQGVLPKLVLLRYLGLRSTVLDSLPSAVADLQHLETLDIKHTNITSLPSSLWKARNLRHLHLNWFYIDFKNILKACSTNVKALTQLQTLSGLVIGEVRENSMTGHMSSMPALTTLKLFLQHSDKEPSGAAGKTVADWISFRLTGLQSLTFGVIQEAKPAEETQLAKEAMKVAKPAEETQLAKEAMKVAKPEEEAQTAKEIKREPAKEAKPTDKAERKDHQEIADRPVTGTVVG